MSEISVLDQSTINKIAAGEVIERPASIIKELVENAMDAKAGAITVEIKEGGIDFIRITDNGMGIPKKEVNTAFLRHATSKIRAVEDLFSISSLGFRGEALSSIAAVCQVEVVTKTNDSMTGLLYRIEGGTEVLQEDIGCPNGTTFIARNLFYNTPARRKFLKSSSTETGYCSDIIERLAISHPNISFKFIVNGKNKLHTSGNNSLKDVIYHIYGREIAANLLNVKSNNDFATIEGFIGKPSISRGNRNYENYYINGRYIKSSLINKAIEDAYKSYNMVHKYPFTVLQFTIDSHLIDINVHPTKMELRFSNTEEIYRLIYQALKTALEGKELIPNIKLDSVKPKIKAKIDKNIPEPFEVKRKETLKQLEIIEEMDRAKNDKEILNLSETLKKASRGIGSTIYNNTIQTDDKSIQQLRETQDKSYYNEMNDNKIQNQEKNITDLKQNYKSKQIDENNINNSNDEKPKNKLENNSLKSDESNNNEIKIDKSKDNNQENNSSETNLKPKQLDLFEEELLTQKTKEKFHIVGQLFSTYWIIELNEKMYIVDQHAAHEKVLYEKTIKNLKQKEFSSQMINPSIVLTLSLREEEALKKYMSYLNNMGFEIEHFGGKEYLVSAVPNDLYAIAQVELLIELIDQLVDDIQKDNLDIINEKIASISCKGAVKGNQKLSYEEAVNLMEQLLELENPYNCPHGRPTIIAMTKYEIEKKFKRIQ